VVALLAMSALDLCHQSLRAPLSVLWYSYPIINVDKTLINDLQYALGGYRVATKRSYGIELALLASIILAGSSIPRALKTQKLLPAVLSGLALFGLYTFGTAYAKKL